MMKVVLINQKREGCKVLENMSRRKKCRSGKERGNSAKYVKVRDQQARFSAGVSQSNSTKAEMSLSNRESIPFYSVKEIKNRKFTL